MSTKKKSTIKFTAMLMVFVLSVAYFSLLSPTSAYFYKTERDNVDVQFALFAVEESQKVFEDNEKVNFPAATKFWDMDELLFDDVIIKKNVTVTNTGEADARIFVHITPDADAIANGFKYMVTKIEKVDSNEETTTSTESALEDETTTTLQGKVEKLPIKAYVENTLGLTNTMSEADAVAALDAYNESNKNTYATISPGESAEVEFILWAEYGNVENTLKDTSNISKIDYNCKIEIIASQNEDRAMGIETTTNAQ